MNAGSEERPPLFYIAHVALRHRRTQLVLIMPKPVQAVLFRVIVALGALLGRYRGTDWPGGPSRCPGDALEVCHIYRLVVVKASHVFLVPMRVSLDWWAVVAALAAIVLIKTGLIARIPW